MTKLFTMKITEEKLSEYKNLARSRGQTLAGFIKNCLDHRGQIREKRTLDPELKRKLSGAVNNLNQIARKLNQGRAVETSMLVELTSIRREIEEIKKCISNS